MVTTRSQEKKLLETPNTSSSFKTAPQSLSTPPSPSADRRTAATSTSPSKHQSRTDPSADSSKPSLPEQSVPRPQGEDGGLPILTKERSRSTIPEHTETENRELSPPTVERDARNAVNPPSGTTVRAAPGLNVALSPSSTAVAAATVAPLNKRKRFTSEEPEDLFSERVSARCSPARTGKGAEAVEDEHDSDEDAPEVISRTVAAKEALQIPLTSSKVSSRKRRKTKETVAAGKIETAHGTEAPASENVRTVSADQSVSNSASNKVTPSEDRHFTIQPSEASHVTPATGRTDTLEEMIEPQAAYGEHLVRQGSLKVSATNLDAISSPDHQDNETGDSVAGLASAVRASAPESDATRLLESPARSTSAKSLSLPPPEANTNSRVTGPSAQSPVAFTNVAPPFTRPDPVAPHKKTHPQSSATVTPVSRKPAEPLPTHSSRGLPKPKAKASSLQQYRSQLLNRHSRTSTWGTPGYRRSRFVGA